MAIDQMSVTFAALADPTRRAVLAPPASGESAVTELAEPFELSLPGVSKHLKVLQRAGLITQGRKAQWRPCRLEQARLKEVADWVERYRQIWDESFDRLGGDLGEKHEETVEGVLDAPRKLVFKAMTDPNLIPKWWGPRDQWTKVDKMDVRSGGSWRFINGDFTGNEYGFHGVYHLIDAPNRVVQTFEFEGVPGHVALETMTLEDLGGKPRWCSSRFSNRSKITTAWCSPACTRGRPKPTTG